MYVEFRRFGGGAYIGCGDIDILVEFFLFLLSFFSVLPPLHLSACRHVVNQ